MAKKEFIGLCRLCLETKSLVDSHIIPDFQYKPLKEREGFFYHLSTDPNQKERKGQKGITERLFCRECDNVRLSKYEQHLAKLIFGGCQLKQPRNERLLKIGGFDYGKIKNGLLSILWRMSISSHPLFEDVQLGEKHEERIRKALLHGAVFLEQEYPILLIAPMFPNGFCSDLILQPDFAHVSGNRVYRCVISGLLFTFYVGSAVVDKQTMELTLKTDNSWAIVRAQVEEIPFLFDAVIRFKQAEARKRQSE